MSSTDGPVSRRSLLQVGAAAAGAFAIVKPEAVRGSQANSQISLGLIGVGGRGTYDATIVHSDPRARVTALCDLFDDRIEMGKQKIGVQNPAVYKDFEKLLASNVDAVLIATPPFEHPRMLEAAIEARKHIYCEKPMGVDAEGCFRVIAAAEKADPTKCISVGFQQRYGPVYLEAYKRIQEGQIGELSNARAFWISGDPFQRRPYSDPRIAKLRNWFSYKDLSGDIIVEQDCHNFDVLHWFLGGLPLRAVGWGGTKVRTSMDILDHLSLTFEWPNGIHVNFEANQITPRGFSRVGEEFTGTKAFIAVSRQQMVHVRGTNDRETIESKRDITYDAIEAFLGMIQSGKVENVAARSAQSTMIAILGRTAIYSGKEVTWKGLYGLQA
jgi:myo-inositol 2-dehydrogenase/D-chiro-inositol 1-dehydrogenase